MTLHQIYLIVLARWRLGLIVLACALSLALALNLLATKQYTATASVILDVKSPDPIAGVALAGMGMSNYMATQIDVLQSERVALRAVEALKLDQNAEWQQAWQVATQGTGNLRAWLAGQILPGLTVKPSRDSNVFIVSYTSNKPELAAEMANAFVNAYIDTTIDLRAEPAKQYNNFFDDRAKQLRENLEKAQAELSRYQQKKGIVATDEKLDVENARLAELSSQYVAMQALATESQSRQSQATQNPNQMQEVLNNSVVSSLTTDLARQEAKLGEISSRLGDLHPDVQQLRANISQLRARIETETRRVTGSVTTNNSVNQARLSQLAASLEAQRKSLLRLKGERDEANVLVRDVENAQRSYDAIFARINQSNMESQATQTNVSILKVAMPPLKPSAPKSFYNLAIGLIAGLFLAIAAMLILEKLDPRLRSEEDVVLSLKQPLLGVLPVRDHASLPGKSKLRLTQGRLIGLIHRPAE